MKQFPHFSNLTELILRSNEVKLVVSVNGQIHRIFAQEHPVSEIIPVPEFIHKSLSDCTNLDLVKQILSTLSTASISLEPQSSIYALSGKSKFVRIFYEIIPIEKFQFLLTLKQIQSQSIINELFALQDIYELLSETNNLDQGIRLILNGLLRMDDLIGGGIILIDQNEEISVNQYFSGIPEEGITDILSSLKELDIREILNQGNVIIKNKQDFHFLFWNDNYLKRIQSQAILPIVNIENLSGFLFLFSSAYDFSNRTNEHLEIVSAQLSRSILRLLNHQKLKQEGQVIQYLFDQSNELGFIINSSGKFVYCTPVLQERLQFSANEIASINFINLLPETQKINFMEMLRTEPQNYHNWESLTLLTKKGHPLKFQALFHKINSEYQSEHQYGILIEEDESSNLLINEPAKQIMGSLIKLPIPVLIVDELSLNISFSNKFANQFFQYQDDELLQKNLTDLISDSENFNLLKLIRENDILRLDSEYAWSLVTKNEEVRKSRFIINRLYFENEKSFLLIIRDSVSETRIMTIKEPDSQYQLDEKEKMICSLTPDGILKTVNQNYCTVVGKSEQKIIGRSFQENLFLSDYEDIFKHFAHLTPNNPVRKNKGRIIDSSGATRWIEWTDQGIFDGDTLVEIIAQGLDITETYQQDLMQRSMEQRYQALVANLPIAIYVIHVITNFYLYISPQMEQIFGYSAEELYLNPEKWNQTIYPDDVQYVQDYFQPESPQELYEPIEFRMYHKNGRLLWARLRGTKITLPDGTILFQGTVWDITEQRTSKEKLEYYYNFESLIIDFSLKLMIANSENFSETINFIVKELGKFMQVDRSYIFDFDHERQTLSNTFEWCAEGVSPQIDQLQDIQMSSIPWLMERVNNNLNIVLDQVNELPEEASQDKESLIAQGIKSLLVVPFVYNNKAMGLIGFDMVKKSTNWEQESINLLRLISAMIISTRDRFRNNP
ncbi:MAG: PAS domain S-box protein [Anaerolineaceae bacterium]|nr:PAS domain S-box protein [Anaerolineaceae bacterium]